MYFGLAISLLLHAGLLAWAVANFHSTSELPMPESPTIEAELVTVSEFTRLKQGDPQAKELEAKEQEKPEPQISKKEAPKPKPEMAEPPPAAAPPPEPEKTEPEKAEKPDKPSPLEKPDPIAEQIAALPPQQPTPEEAAKLEAERKAKAEQERKKKEAERKKKEAEQKKKEAARKKREEERKKKLAEEKRRQEAKNKESFTDRMAALIDKTPEKRGSPRSGQAPSKPTDYEGPTAGEREGRGNELTAREADLLKGQISAQLRNCWRLPGGGGGIEAIVVTVRWRLREDGSLDGPPTVENGRSDPVFQAAARAALAAVTECAPFNLPRDRYTAWRTIIWDFDPRHML
ncbi:Cell envelope protein TolA [Candidatus Filomicrobium marinum]|uniref:Cell envelope protein TolA n=2 Tax=Filomicrobium TaxID=119044 RepID=A0A0D6J9T7_9HYPH|nr:MULTISPECIES: cell envelope integrity protein TolA [Filomicrobium]MCV0368687.1 cell envelope integrity protein TolA [Filomicrobium sp.]CFX00089.1 Cell envelope protein TolA [Candidatus Filomicrobium marinum]CPR15169.1 Cell envelope protein TolA [Candidatus Filomicrobium marinum]SDO69783.1 colicin import membrane protein [Filomicrobium insigne]